MRKLITIYQSPNIHEKDFDNAGKTTHLPKFNIGRQISKQWKRWQNALFSWELPNN